MTWWVILANGEEITDCAPEDVPREPRVVCIAQDGEAAKLRGQCLVNGDWFCYRDDEGAWSEHSDTGILFELVDHAHVIRAVRPGKWVDRPTFKRLWARGRELVNE